jgi:hypothetical protein
VVALWLGTLMVDRRRVKLGELGSSRVTLGLGSVGRGPFRLGSCGAVEDEPGGVGDGQRLDLG